MALGTGDAAQSLDTVEFELARARGGLPGVSIISLVTAFAGAPV